MTRRPGNIHELDLLAYADGRLDADPARKAAVEHYLRTRPGLRATLGQDRRIIQLIRTHYRPALDETPPPAMLATLRTRDTSRAARLPRLAAGAAAFALAAVAAFALRPPSTGRVAEAPALSVAAASDLPLVLQSRGEGVFPDLAPWRLQRLEANLRDGDAPLRAVYELDGRSITLSIGPARAEGASYNGAAVSPDVRWVSGALSYWLSGEAPETELRAIAAHLRDGRGPPARLEDTPPAVVDPGAASSILAAADTPATEPGLPPDALTTVDGALIASP